MREKLQIGVYGYISTTMLKVFGSSKVCWVVCPTIGIAVAASSR
jgi:hypothetical protein